MSTEVGSGHISIEPRINNAAVARFNASMSKMLRNQTIHVGIDVNRTGLKAFEARIKSMRPTIKVNVNVDKKNFGGISRTLNRVGSDGGSSLLMGMSRSLSQGFSGIFSNPHLLATAAGALVALAAPLGAMFTGAFFASLGIGAAIGAAVVAGIADPRIPKALGQLKDKFLKGIDLKKVSGPVLEAIKKLSDALGPMMGPINAFLGAATSLLPPLTDGLISFINAVLPALTNLLNSPFMAELIRVVADGLQRIGEAFANSINRFLSNKDAVDGAIRGLELLVQVVAWAIEGFSWFMTALSWVFNMLWRFGRALPEIWDTAWGATKSVFNGAIQWIINTWNTFTNWFFGVLHAIVNFWIGVWNWIYKHVHDIWNAIWTSVSHFFQAVANFIGNTLNSIKNFWNSVWSTVRNFVGGVWQAIWNVISGAFNRVGSFIVNTLRFLGNFWSGVWSAIRNVAGQIWQAIWNVITGAFNRIGAFIVGTLRAIGNFWSGVWSAIRNVAGQVWQAIWNVVSGAFQRVANFIGSTLNTIRNVWSGAWNAVGNLLDRIWTNIKNWTHTAMEFMKTAIGSGLDKIKKSWTDIWNGVRDFFSNVWFQIGTTAAKAINFVLGILQKGVNLINGILGKIGVSWKIPDIGQVALPTAPGHADGGHIRGPGTETSDSIPANLSRNEYVIKAKSAKRIGYSRLHYMNAYGDLPGYASGGKIGGKHIVWRGASGDNEGLMNEHRNHVHVGMGSVPASHNGGGNPTINAIAAKSHIPNHPTSGYRAGDLGGRSWHAKGQATDFGGFNQDALAMFFAQQPGVSELIHRSSKGDYGIFGGKGGGGGFLNKWLRRGAKFAFDHFVAPGIDGAKRMMPRGQLWGEFGWGALDNFKQALIKKIQDQIDQDTAMDQGSSGSPTAASAGGVTRWTSTVSKALSMLGLPQNWVKGVLARIAQESSGDPNVVNRTDSNAQAGHPSQGLMQTIPSTFNAYKVPGHGNILDPLDNILAALRYIKAKYGSVYSLPKGGYDNGGILPSGAMAVNTSGKPEMVLNAAQAKAFENRITSDGGTHTHNVYVDGVKVAHRATIEESNANLVRSLNRGY